MYVYIYIYIFVYLFIYTHMYIYIYIYITRRQMLAAGDEERCHPAQIELDGHPPSRRILYYATLYDTIRYYTILYDTIRYYTIIYLNYISCLRPPAPAPPPHRSRAGEVIHAGSELQRLLPVNNKYDYCHYYLC